MKRSLSLGALFTLVSGGAALGLHCGPEAKTPVGVKEGVVRVAEGLCKEAAKGEGGEGGLSAEEIELLCSTAGGVVRVLLPRGEWHAIRARASRVDAGPGR